MNLSQLGSSVKSTQWGMKALNSTPSTTLTISLPQSVSSGKYHLQLYGPLEYYANYGPSLTISGNSITFTLGTAVNWTLVFGFSNGTSSIQNIGWELIEFN